MFIYSFNDSNFESFDSAQTLYFFFMKPYVVDTGRRDLGGFHR